MGYIISEKIFHVLQEHLGKGVDGLVREAVLDGVEEPVNQVVLDGIKRSVAEGVFHACAH